MLNFLAAVAVLVFCLGIGALAVIMIGHVLDNRAEVTKVMTKGTKKAFVLNMLQEGPRTRDELLTALCEQFPNNKSKKQTANYLSVILDYLKKDGIKIVSHQRGTYRIAEPKNAVRVKRAYKTPVIR